MKLANAPIHPCIIEPNAQEKAFGQGPSVILGMTLRQHYAGLAMQGFVSADDYQHVMLGREYGVDDFAAASVRIADALIAALENPQ
jgi:hypothetical protein